MNGTIKKVFLIIALLVLIFLIWQLFFNDNGILVTAYNSMADGVNDMYQKATGGTNVLLPYWGTNNSGNNVQSGADNNGTGFNMDTGATP